MKIASDGPTTDLFGGRLSLTDASILQDNREVEAAASKKSSTRENTCNQVFHSIIDTFSPELQDKFGLHDFKVLDNDCLTRDLIPNLPPGANPWYYANRVITSIDYAKQEKVLRALRKTRWDLVIVDEAHYLAESGNELKPGRTDRSRFGQIIAQCYDSLLLLTATPHNGYAQSFYSLLRLLVLLC